MNDIRKALNCTRVTPGMGRRRFKRLNRVYDRWWPWRLGRVIRLKPLRIRWSDGNVWIYDRAHQQFLEKVLR